MSNVQIILTKWDKVVGKVDEFIEDKFKWLSDRHRHRLATLTTHKAAFAPQAPLKLDMGWRSC